jgi:hypothetical protein
MVVGGLFGPGCHWGAYPVSVTVDVLANLLHGAGAVHNQRVEPGHAVEVCV